MKHMKKRVAALLLTLAMVLSLMPMALAADEFPDMPAEDDASYAAVKSAVDNGIMTGENGNLNLEGTILRSTVSKMVVTAFAAKGEADLSGYPDVDADMWYAAWMAKANQMGIMTGTSGKMNPNSTVTLAEVAAMLVRALGLSVDKDATVDGVAAWAAPYVKALIDAGYISAEVAAAAHEPMTRGAFAEVIYKVSGEGNYAKEENAEITEDVNGNIVITANGVSLKGITVKGDVIIADGVDASSVTLDGVKIEGRLVVRGAGAELTNGTTASATVVAATTGETTVKADTSSDAGDIAVAGTNGQAADKVVLDMAEPKATVTTATDVAVQNAKGGEVTLAAPNASLSVESGTVANVTVADGASGVKVDVAEGATIEKVTTNTDLAITGEGTVTEKEGSGTVTDAEGNEVAGSDEPVEVPTVSDGVADPVDPNAPTNPVHTHIYSEKPDDFDATRHIYTCEGKAAEGKEGEEGYVPAIEGCGATRYENHTFVEGTCACGHEESVPVAGDVTEGAGACGGSHVFANVEDAGNKAVSCTENGVQKQQCTNMVTGDDDSETRCTATRTVTTEATGHSYTATGSTPATCKDDGETTFTCTKCADDADGHTTTAVIPATGNHTWKLTATVPATCTTEGYYTYTCTACDTEDESKTIAVNPNAHVWGTAAKDEGADATTHTFSCTVEGCGGDDGPATRTVNCQLIADNSTYKAPTCQAAGKEADKTCSACSRKVTGAEIAKTSHTANSAWVKTDASGHYHTCKFCNEQIEEEKLEHTGENSCSTCGWTKGGSGSDGGEEVECQVDHTKLHVGQACSTQGCKKTGNVAHTYSNGTCSCGATCTADTCPDKGSHSVGTKCDTCGTTPADGG